MKCVCDRKFITVTNIPSGDRQYGCWLQPASPSSPVGSLDTGRERHGSWTQTHNRVNSQRPKHHIPTSQFSFMNFPKWICFCIVLQPTPHRSSSPCSSAGRLGRRWWTQICGPGLPVVKISSLTGHVCFSKAVNSFYVIVLCLCLLWWGPPEGPQFLPSLRRRYHDTPSTASSQRLGSSPCWSLQPQTCTDTNTEVLRDSQKRKLS